MSMIALKSQTSTSTANRPLWNSHKTNAKYQVRQNKMSKFRSIFWNTSFTLFLNSHSCWLYRAKRRRILDFFSVVANVSAVVRSFYLRNNFTALGRRVRIQGKMTIPLLQVEPPFLVDRLLLLTPFPRCGTQMHAAVLASGNGGEGRAVITRD